MTPIMPSAPPAETTSDLLTTVTPAALAVFEITDTDDLFASELEDESTEEREARLVAAADILDDRLSEIAAQTVTSEVIRGWSA